MRVLTVHPDINPLATIIYRISMPLLITQFLCFSLGCPYSLSKKALQSGVLDFARSQVNVTVSFHKIGNHPQALWDTDIDSIASWPFTFALHVRLDQSPLRGALTRQLHQKCVERSVLERSMLIRISSRDDTRQYVGRLAPNKHLVSHCQPK